MGAWDETIFGNDSACDWALEFAEQEDESLSFVSSTLDAVLELTESDYMDVDIGTNALAAADVMTRLKGHFYIQDVYTEELDAWVKEHPIIPSPELIAKALKAVDIVEKSPNSELRGLWDDDGISEAWHADVARLRQRLQANGTYDRLPNA